MTPAFPGVYPWHSAPPNSVSWRKKKKKLSQLLDHCDLWHLRVKIPKIWIKLSEQVPNWRIKNVGRCSAVEVAARFESSGQNQKESFGQNWSHFVTKPDFRRRMHQFIHSLDRLEQISWFAGVAGRPRTQQHQCGRKKKLISFQVLFFTPSHSLISVLATLSDLKVILATLNDHKVTYSFDMLYYRVSYHSKE